MVRSERVEVRLDDELLERVDRWIEQTRQASSRSDAVRQLVSLGLDTVTGKSVRLSDGEKINFMLLRDIVKHLKINAETDVDFIADTIYGGHYWAPTWEMPGLFHNHTDNPADVSLVVDTLDMWSFIEERIEKMSPEDIEKIKAANYGLVPQFNGFDGNNEASLMSIARFFVERMDRFAKFKGRDFNSHSPKESQYRRMVAVFEPIRATLGFGKQLTPDQIIAMLKV